MQASPKFTPRIARLGGAPSCPVGITGRDYLVFAKITGTTTVYAYRYTDDQYQETLATKSYSGVFLLPGTVPYNQTALADLDPLTICFVAGDGSSTDDENLVTWDIDANTFAVNHHYSGFNWRTILIDGTDVFSYDTGGGFVTPFRADVGGSGSLGSGIEALLGAGPAGWDFTTNVGGSPSGFLWGNASQLYYHGFDGSSEEAFVTFPGGGAATIVTQPGSVPDDQPSALGESISAGRMLGQCNDGFPLIFGSDLSAYRPWPDAIWNLGGEVRHNQAGTEMIVGGNGAPVLRTLIPSAAVSSSCALPTTFPDFEAGPDGADYVCFFPLD